MKGVQAGGRRREAPAVARGMGTGGGRPLPPARKFLKFSMPKDAFSCILNDANSDVLDFKMMLIWQQGHMQDIFLGRVHCQH